ncbi:double-stranded RNA-binding protein 7 [Amborella trichopoda]|uniref:double-stranded RNA-binding protein 7 n=1 Tax=Amborella trichopoda TaxID=13333 RepID=UPI0005D374DE|nr:double-stranded RNA-binding protein 7 [Amborella trichopoda]|eukprot:XP_011626425.1 double-stranded RNA-binding protein 7 [Amborella trichopoda]
MLNGNGFAGVSNCYVFKSRLQEYAQKAGIPTPVYETVKEGPSHEPIFRSSVTINDVKYDSLPGFANRKAAEQSAAEVALMELLKSGTMDCIPHPVHETGLCKNLLQEYAQKMSYSVPSYTCTRDSNSNISSFVCTVEIGGIQYIGGAAKTKKEAEIKAARTALLAIQSNNSETSNSGSVYTVLPGNKKEKVSDGRSETPAPLKTKKKKSKFKKGSQRRHPRFKGGLKVSENEQEKLGPTDGSIVKTEGFGDVVGAEARANDREHLKPDEAVTRENGERCHQLEHETEKASTDRDIPNGLKGFDHTPISVEPLGAQTSSVNGDLGERVEINSKGQGAAMEGLPGVTPNLSED